MSPADVAQPEFVDGNECKNRCSMPMATFYSPHEKFRASQDAALIRACSMLFIIVNFWNIYFGSLFFLALSNRPNPPPHRKTSLPKHSDVKKQFLEICHTTLSDDVKVALRLPSFDSYDYEDFEILHLMEMMFVELNFIEKFHISSARLREWLYEVYKHYNDVPFHNFRHCFCVSQMVSSVRWNLFFSSRETQFAVPFSTVQEWEGEGIKIMMRIFVSFITSA